MGLRYWCGCADLLEGHGRRHAFYLLAEGLPGAIGIADAEIIYYRTLTTKLFREAEFTDTRLGAIASAEELFGVGSVQALKTAESFDAVEIFDTVSTL